MRRLATAIALGLGALAFRLGARRKPAPPAPVIEPRLHFEVPPKRIEDTHLPHFHASRHNIPARPGGTVTDKLHGGPTLMAWKLQDAIVIWLSERERVNGRWTCAEIANGLNVAEWFSRSNGTIRPADVNAAISGMSIRSRLKKYVTDIAPEASVHTPITDGLRTAWQHRYWSLTPSGLNKAMGLVSVGNRKLAYTIRRIEGRTQG